MTRHSPGDPVDFRLVESHGSWRLTIRVGDRLLAAIADEARGDNSTGLSAPAFTAQVEPTLLPSGVLDVEVDVVLEGSGKGSATASDSL